MRKFVLALVLIIIFATYSVSFPVFTARGEQIPVQETTAPQELLDYTNNVDGYKIKYPARMKIDESLPALGTVITDDKTRIEIYYDDFTGSSSVSSVYSYINYSSQFTSNTKHHMVLDNSFSTINGNTVHILSWYRPKLALIPDDKNYYLCAEIIKNNQEVYTIFFKSSEPLTDYSEILESFTLAEISQTAEVRNKFKPVDREWNEETVRFYQEFFIDNPALNWGIFEYTAPEDNFILSEIENSLQYRFPLILKYRMLDSPFPLLA